MSKHFQRSLGSWSKNFEPHSIFRKLFIHSILVQKPDLILTPCLFSAYLICYWNYKPFQKHIRLMIPDMGMQFILQISHFKLPRKLEGESALRTILPSHMKRSYRYICISWFISGLSKHLLSGSFPFCPFFCTNLYHSCTEYELQ